MAAFSTVRLFDPRAVSPAAALPPTRRIRRRSIDLSQTVATIWRVTREWLLFLWMLAAVSFLLLMGAGGAGFLR
jgi:hypothetical protein